MHSKAKPATDAEKKRFEAIVERGCIACRTNGHPSLYPVEIHHLIDGMKRRGHSATVGLCSMHHRGIIPGNMSRKKALEMFGPNLADDGKAFRAKYGNDDSLLGFQEFLLTLPPEGEK